MTVAPSTPAASHSMPASRIRRGGAKPASASCHAGCASASWITKHKLTNRISAVTARCNGRLPRLCSASIANVPTADISTPTVSETPSSICNATALPTTSATSHAMIATSHASHSRMVVRRL